MLSMISSILLASILRIPHAMRYLGLNICSLMGWQAGTGIVPGSSSWATKRSNLRACFTDTLLHKLPHGGPLCISLKESHHCRPGKHTFLAQFPRPAKSTILQAWRGRGQLEFWIKWAQSHQNHTSAAVAAAAAPELPCRSELTRGEATCLRWIIPSATSQAGTPH